jgi:hypothetical protein
MISTASFEPTVVLPANNSSAAKLEQNAAFSAYAEVRAKWLCNSRVALLSSKVLLSYMCITWWGMHCDLRVLSSKASRHTSCS